MRKYSSFYSPFPALDSSAKTSVVVSIETGLFLLIDQAAAYKFCQISKGHCFTMVGLLHTDCLSTSILSLDFSFQLN